MEQGNNQSINNQGNNQSNNNQGNNNQPNSMPPENYMLWAILSTIFCFWPVGIVAIIKASQVNSFWQLGDTQGAMKASADAKKWSIYTAVAGVVAIVLALVYFFVIVAMFASEANVLENIPVE